jgi:hypothetical protein
LRIREDTAKYLLNLDVDSAHYDPKTRSMREDPLPDADPNEKFYGVSAFEDYILYYEFFGVVCARLILCIYLILASFAFLL